MRGSPFFDDVSQVEGAIGDGVGRLPVFYYDGAAIAAFFPAKLRALQRLMPDPRMRPARVLPGVGLVTIFCFEYRDTDIAPYNELAISVALNEPWFLPNVPGRALIGSLRHRQLHGWVHHLPVTTEIARAGGVDFYNYPKFIGGIEFTDTHDARVCTLSEGRELILSLAGRRIPTPRRERLQLFSHLWMDRQPQSSEFKINALELGISMRADAATLTLGDRHPIARELASLLITRRPVQYAYVPRFEAILYGPEHLTPSLIQRLDVMSAPRKEAGVTS